MNLPAGCTEEMVDAQCSPIAKGTEPCYECDEYYPAVEMYPWEKYDWQQHNRHNVYLCVHCVPRCEWRYGKEGSVNIDLHKCGRIQSPTAQGPWCAEHDRESEMLNEEEL